MGLILTYDGELYMEPFGSYGEETKIIKIIPKYDKPSNNNLVNYVDADCYNRNFVFGDIVQVRGTNEILIFVCKQKRFAYLCQLDSDVCFKGFKRLPLEKLLKKNGRLIKPRKTKLLNNISEAREVDKYIPEEIKNAVYSLIKRK